jgi:eukaryotic-like serine/threonine-protein kinase
MSSDITQTQAQDGTEYKRARELSLQDRQPPGQVPGYRLERCLGEGAYGEVWAAVDLNNPGRRVAIKFYTRRGGDWALLVREVEKLNYLATDRYVVQLLDVGWNNDPPYYVMEYMEQGSLAERLQAGPLALPDAVAMFREIAMGVVNAHNRGVLHCDLKPANILLGPDGKPRLADFGQSRMSQDQTPALGTLFYMAPEQADLRAVPDAHWDVYALGAVFYCMLTGQPPFRDDPDADTLASGGTLEERLARYRQVVQQAPRPRQHRRVARVDRALGDILDRCLAIVPAKRFPNVQAVLNALDTRAHRRARRPLLVMGVVAPIVLLLLMGLLIRSQLRAATEKSTNSLKDEARVSNQFAAQAVAEKVAGKIDRRWRMLEQEAMQLHLKKLLLAARGKGVDSPEHAELQKWLDARFHAHPEFASHSWALFDAQGNLLLRSPHDPRIDQQHFGSNHARKNFFSGLLTDVDPNAPTPPPLTHVHRSNVFLSKMTGSRTVAFSVPVWKDSATGPEAPRLGVLMMTVQVGSFAELRPEDGGHESYAAVLVDRRPDDHNCPGAILEHPRLAELRRQPDKIVEDELRFYVDAKQLQPGAWDEDYADPVGKSHADYEGRWLAASAPVIIAERPDVRDIGWVVLVQERYDTAIGPVLALEKDMLAQGRWSLGLALTIVTALWVFVIVVLNESVGGPLIRRLRRRMGIGVDSVSSGKGSVRPPPTRPGATLTEPNKR